MGEVDVASKLAEGVGGTPCEPVGIPIQGISVVEKKSIKTEIDKIIALHPEHKEVLSVVMDMNESLATWYVEAIDTQNELLMEIADAICPPNANPAKATNNTTQKANHK